MTEAGPWRARVPRGVVERDHSAVLGGGGGRFAPGTPARDAAWLEAICEAAPFAIVAVDPRGRVTLWSPGAERMFAWTAQELLGQPLPVSLDGAAEDFELVREALRSARQLVGHEILRRAAGGGHIVTSVSTVPLYDPDGELIETIAVIEDLTDQRRTEQRLLESKERFQASVENLLDAFGIFTAVRGDEGRIIDFRTEFANTGSTAISWAEGSSDVEVSLLGLLAGSERETLFEELCRVVETGAPLATGLIVREDAEGGGGSGRAFKVRAAKLGDGFAAVWEDVTEHLAAETELERRSAELTVVGELAELLQAVTSSEEVFELVASFGARLFDGLSGGLFLRNESGSLVEALASWGDEVWSEQVFAPDDCWALRRGRRHGGLNGESAPRCRHIREGPAPFLCVPLVAQGQAAGLLHVVAPTRRGQGERRPSSAADEALAVSVAEHIGLALTNLRLMETLRHQSIRDPLTELFNRRYFEETLEREIKRAERSGQPLSLMMLDIDHFKLFNDTYGHTSGDGLMQDLSGLLYHQTRGGDVACRVGGDEFLLLLPETSFEAALRRAWELREAVEGLEVIHNGVAVPITVTLGVATFPDHADGMSALISAADDAMYRAKRAGGNAVGEAVASAGLAHGEQ